MGVICTYFLFSLVKQTVSKPVSLWSSGMRHGTKVVLRRPGYLVGATVRGEQQSSVEVN